MLYLSFGILALVCIVIGHLNEKNDEKAIIEYLSKEHDIILKEVLGGAMYRVLYGGDGKEYMDNTDLTYITMEKKSYAIVAKNCKSYRSNNPYRRYR